MATTSPNRHLRGTQVDNDQGWQLLVNVARECYECLCLDFPRVKQTEISALVTVISQLLSAILSSDNKIDTEATSCLLDNFPLCIDVVRGVQYNALSSHDQFFQLDEEAYEEHRLYFHRLFAILTVKYPQVLFE